MDGGILRPVVVRIAIACGIEEHLYIRMRREVVGVGQALQGRQGKAGIELACLHGRPRHVLDEFPCCLRMLRTGIGRPGIREGQVCTFAVGGHRQRYNAILDVRVGSRHVGDEPTTLDHHGRSLLAKGISIPRRSNSSRESTGVILLKTRVEIQSTDPGLVIEGGLRPILIQD